LSHLYGKFPPSSPTSGVYITVKVRRAGGKGRLERAQFASSAEKERKRKEKRAEKGGRRRVRVAFLRLSFLPLLFFFS